MGLVLKNDPFDSGLGEGTLCPMLKRTTFLRFVTFPRWHFSSFFYRCRTAVNRQITNIWTNEWTNMVGPIIFRVLVFPRSLASKGTNLTTVSGEKKGQEKMEEKLSPLWLWASRFKRRPRPSGFPIKFLRWRQPVPVRQCFGNVCLTAHSRGWWLVGTWDRLIGQDGTLIATTNKRVEM